jgi:hypothetical protein
MFHSLIGSGIRPFLMRLGALSLALLIYACLEWPTSQDVGVARSQGGRAEYLQQVLTPSFADCGPGTYPRLLFEDKVETGPLEWTHSGLSDSWGISDWRSYSASHAWYAPGLAVISDQSLLSPPIVLPENETPLSLRFWNYQDFEYSSSGCYDGALLEISMDNGQSWTQLDSQLLSDPYDGIIEAGGGNPLAGRGAWCGHPQDWLESIVALDEFAGQTVRFRFRVGTDSSVSREGWFLDDFSVQSCPSAYIASFQDESRLSGLPGEQVFHHFRLENQGLEDQYTFHLESGNWPSELLTSVDVTLLSGEVFTASVGVDLPAAPGGQQLGDIFALKVDSAGNPDLVMQSAGISSLDINPAVSVTSDQDNLFGYPGEIVTHTFSLTNTGDSEDSFHLELVGADWHTFVSTDTVQLPAGGKKLIPAQVTIPVGPLRADSIVITDTFLLRAESGWSADIGDEAASSTSTGLFAGLRLDGPSIMDGYAGSPLLVYFYLTNLGNFTDRYALVWQGDWLSETPVSSTGWIAPGGREELMASILIPPEILDGAVSSLKLRATSQLDPVIFGEIHLTINGWKRVFLPLISLSH